MQGDPRVDRLMYPVELAIKRHVKDSDAITEIYNRAYEAIMNSMDVIDTSAKVAAKQIAENAKNLQRAEKAVARADKLQTALQGLLQFELEDALDEKYWTPGYLAVINAARGALKGGES